MSEGNSIEKGLEVTCSTGTKACEYRVGGYCIGSAIYGLDSFPLLVPSHIDYSNVEPGLSDRAYLLQKATNYVHQIIFSH